MNRLLVAVLVSSLVMIQPIYTAERMLFTIERIENPAQAIKQIVCASGHFSSNSARQFVFQLKKDVKEKHGIDLDLKQIIDEATKVIIQSGQFSESEIATARVFYSQLIHEETNLSKNFRLFGKKQKKNKHCSTAKNQELALPDKMALGFVFILSGSLLCILPFGVTQGIGTGLIGTGLYSIADGVRDGERPYYVDPQTGNRLSE